MTENKAKQKENYTIKIKSIVIARPRTCQTHHRATIICPGKGIIKAKDVIKIRAI